LEVETADLVGNVFPSIEASIATRELELEIMMLDAERRLMTGSVLNMKDTLSNMVDLELWESLRSSWKELGLGMDAEVRIVSPG
jgi:hypothetical protein